MRGKRRFAKTVRRRVKRGKYINRRNVATLSRGGIRL